MTIYLEVKMNDEDVESPVLECEGWIENGNAFIADCVDLIRAAPAEWEWSLTYPYNDGSFGITDSYMEKVMDEIWRTAEVLEEFDGLEEPVHLLREGEVIASWQPGVPNLLVKLAFASLESEELIHAENNNGDRHELLLASDCLCCTSLYVRRLMDDATKLATSLSAEDYETGRAYFEIAFEDRHRLVEWQA